MKTILKFDSGKRGFIRAIYLLVGAMLFVLTIGGYVVWDLLR